MPLKPKKFYGSYPLRMRDFLENLIMTSDRYQEGTRVLNLNFVAFLVRALEWFQTDRMIDGPMFKNHFLGISTLQNV